jgi:hypothetical protein
MFQLFLLEKVQVLSPSYNINKYFLFKKIGSFFEALQTLEMHYHLVYLYCKGNDGGNYDHIGQFCAIEEVLKK